MPNNRLYHRLFLNHVELLKAHSPVNLSPTTKTSLTPIDGRITFFENDTTTYTVDAPNGHGDGAEVLVGKKPAGRQTLTVIRVRKNALLEMIDGSGKKKDAIKSLLLEDGDWYVMLANSGGKPVPVK